MLDKVFLFLFGVEWFAFGVLGLFFPEFIIGLLGVYDYSLVFLNETRALYAFFTFVGLMSFICLLYTSPSPRDVEESRMPSSA